MTFLSSRPESPILGNLSKLEFYHPIVLVHKGAHVCLETLWSIKRTQRESQLNIVFWVCSNNEVDVTPVSQKTSFYICNHIWKLLLIHFFEIPRPCCRIEFAIKFFRIIDPPSSQYLKCISLVWIVFREEAYSVLLVVS